MRETYTITLEVEDEEIPVELEEIGMLTRASLSSILSTNTGDDPMDMVRDPNIDEFIEEEIKAVSDFPPELIDDLPEDQFHKLLESCSLVMAGDDPNDQSQTFEHSSNTGSGDPFEDIDLNSDGSVDPDDWR